MSSQREKSDNRLVAPRPTHPRTQWAYAWLVLYKSLSIAFDCDYDLGRRRVQEGSVSTWVTERGTLMFNEEFMDVGHGTV